MYGVYKLRRDVMQLAATNLTYGNHLTNGCADEGETTNQPPNQSLHRTAIPLRSIAAGELGR